MPILNLQLSQIGAVGTSPQIIMIKTNDPIATITSTGYLNHEVQNGFYFPPTAMALVTSSNQGTVWCQVSVNGSNTSLIQAFNQGSLVLAGTPNTGGAITTIANASMGQPSTILIPDPAGPSADFVIAPAALVSGNLISASGVAGLVIDSTLAASNVQLKSGVHAGVSINIGGSGAGPLAVAVAGATTSSIVVASVVSSSNPCSVIAVVATNTGFNVTVSTSPGASLIVNYVLYVVPQ